MGASAKSILVKRYIEKAMVDLPPMPGMVLKVIQATERSDVTMRELERMIVTDPAITAKVLKVVNSAYFGLPQQVGNIAQAVAILGVHQVRNLTLSMGVVSALETNNSRVEHVQKRYWRRSFGAAFAAQWLAEEKLLAVHSQEAAFVGGLLHDVGRLFLFSLFSMPYRKVLAEAELGERSLIEIESDILGIDHATLGGMLAERWNFPDDLREVIEMHEGPFDAVRPVTFCVHAADRLAHLYTIDIEDGATQSVEPIVADWLDLTEDKKSNLGSRVAGKVLEATDVLEL